MTYDPQNLAPPGAKIKVIGVGGGGGNAINTMIRSGLEGVDFISCNTDVQALRFSLAPSRIQVGKELTRGLGAGADPDVGRDAALEDRHEIQELLTGADMVFITAGMGGGTGTGGASVVAQIARELGALTVAVVTKPFQFEGNRRRRHGEAGVARLRECVDTLITIPNQRLLQVASPGLSMLDAFKMADEVLVNAVRGISDIINIPGTVNVDFADVKTIMSCMGHALMGIGHATGEKRAIEAARMAISSPLLEDIDIEGATGILINITAGANVTLMEVNEACSIIQEAAHEDANIIFGSVTDDTLGDQIRVTVIATGFPVDEDGRATSDYSGSTKSPQPLQFASRLTTPGLITPKSAHRPASQHLSSFTPKRPEPSKSTLTESYAFHGGTSAAHSESATTPPPATQQQSPGPQAQQEPQFIHEPLSQSTLVPEPKPFFNRAADPAPAASSYEPQISVESEAQDLMRLTMYGSNTSYAAAPIVSEEEDKEEAEEVNVSDSPISYASLANPATESFESLANPFVVGLEIQGEMNTLGEGYEQDHDYFSAEDQRDDDDQDEEVSILLSQPSPRTIIQPNEPEVIIKETRVVATSPEVEHLESKDVRIGGATAIVDPSDDFVSHVMQPTKQQETAIADSLFDDLDDFLSEANAPGIKPPGSVDSEEGSAPLDSFFSSETAAIAGDIDRKINEALELAERMKNPSDTRGTKLSPADDLDVPAFLRNGMRDLPLG